MKIRRLPGDDQSRDGYLRLSDTIEISQQELDALRKKNLPNWGLWVHYTLKSKNDVFSAEDKKLYAFFCVGFLIYYDHVLRNVCEEHEIYFDWNPANQVQGKTIQLDIYINPPPRIQGVTQEKHYPNIPALNPQKMLLADYGFTSDPPQPPPPPPPIM